jgi:hypothetical protein
MVGTTIAIYRIMKTFKIKLQIFTLVGTESREIKLEAKTEKSAEKKIASLMGNRDFQIISISVQ